jgi:hypothetical protein
VTGYSRSANSGDVYFTIAYDASDGMTRWARRYAGSSSDRAYAVAASPDGSEVFVTGTSRGATASDDYYTIAYDASTGTMRWAARYFGPDVDGADVPSAIAPSPDGSRVFVTGSSPMPGLSGFATVAYDASTGARLWVRRFHHGPSFEDYPTAMVASPDSSEVFVTGSSAAGNDGTDYATVAYDASTGATRWVRRYNGPTDMDDFATSIAAGPDGSAVFVTGGSVTDSELSDYVTLAYDTATGATLWIMRKGKPATNERARAIAVSPDGSKVFVTGDSWIPGGSIDYATVAYEP